MFLDYFQFEFTPVQLVLIGLLALLFVMQLFYYLHYYAQILYYFRKQKKEKIDYTNARPPVSVIVYAKNESEGLQKFLPSLLEQNYPKYEVIVVNDGSTDESEAVLHQFTQKYPHLYHTFLPIEAKHISTKKVCLTVGIKAAKNEWVLFTDADCSVDAEWLNRMARNYTPHIDIVLGYASYAHKKTFIDKWISFDSLFNALEFMSMALKGKTYMSAGQNLSYHKDLFFRNRGFSSHLELPSGEDDLFISDIATRRNVRIEVSPESVVRTNTPYSFRNWRNLKENASYTARYYSDGVRIFKALERVSRYGFYLLLAVVAALGTPTIWAGVFLLFAVRYVTQLVVINRTAKKMGERRFCLNIIVFDLLIPLNDWLTRIIDRQGKRVFMGR